MRCPDVITAAWEWRINYNRVNLKHFAESAKAAIYFLRSRGWRGIARFSSCRDSLPFRVPGIMIDHNGKMLIFITIATCIIIGIHAPLRERLIPQCQVLIRNPLIRITIAIWQ